MALSLNKPKLDNLAAYRKPLIHECVTGRRRITDADVACARQNILKQKRAEYGGQIVSALRRQLPWTHFAFLIYLDHSLLKCDLVQRRVTEAAT